MNADTLNELENALASMKADRVSLDSQIVGLEAAIRRLRAAQQEPTGTPVMAGLGKYSKMGATPTVLDILKESKRRMSTTQIKTSAVSQGFTSTSRNLSNLFYGILRRLDKEGRIRMIQQDGKTFFEAK